MTPGRLLGQVLLWAGFISAALAACSQREFDILPETERAALNQLPEKLNLTEDQLNGLTTKSLSELTRDELDSLVTKVIPIHEQNVEEEQKSEGAPKEESETPIKKVSKENFEKSRLTIVENKWPTVPWMWYCLSLAVGCFGVVLLRATAKTAQQETGRVAEEYSTLTASLIELNKSIASLSKNLDKMAPRDVVHYIDDHCADYFSDFADARNSLTQRFGLQPYAEIMTQFASAERFVNRTWSAAADGYMNEARDSVERALAHLVETSALLKQYEMQNSA